MPGKHNAGGCGCCGDCTDNDSARIYLQALYGITDLTASGGPSKSTTTIDWKQRTCAPLYPDGSSDGPYPAFDFSGAIVESITSSPTTALVFACPPSGGNSFGPLDYYCPGSPLGAVRHRGFAFRSGVSCTGSLDYFASFSGSIVFSCVSKVAKYKLSVGTSVLVYVDDAGYFGSLPTTGVNWTRVDFGAGTSTFTKNGSTDDEGALFATTFVRGFGGGSVLSYNSQSWTSNPNMSVSMWTPDPLIDWTNLTLGGTATLS